MTSRVNSSASNWQQDCAALIPCFNEAATIGDIVRTAREHLPTVFVVDDGSTDDSVARAIEGGAEVVRHATNRGKGAALLVGFQHLRDRGFIWALTLDGDGQHAVKNIPDFFRCAESTRAALVIGNRLTECQKIPWLRRRVNRWMTRRLSRRAGVTFADSQCGFRLVNLAALAALPLASDHFEIESEMLLAFAAESWRIEFVPVEVIYKPRTSKIHPLIDTWRWIRWWLTTRPRGAAALKILRPLQEIPVAH
ncbi:MAG: glycosyltransferase family 2 protein [Pedosphaera sp.]|nr:glycosyltransferase family 2 protein [Pedosphaera sp.]